MKHTTTQQERDLLALAHEVSDHHDRSPICLLDISRNVVEELLSRFPAPDCWEQQQAVDRAQALIDDIEEARDIGRKDFRL